MKNLFFSNDTMTMLIKFWENETTALQRIKPNNPYTLAGFEPGIFYSGDGRDGHYATPTGFSIFIASVAPFSGLCCGFMWLKPKDDF
jgi:hypothetical protein